MGVWNQTCMATHVPIRPSEPVKLFMLRARVVWPRGPEALPLQSTSGASSSSETWEPLGLPLTGSYDYYGAADNLRSDAAFVMADGYFRRHHGRGVAEVLRVIHHEPDFHLRREEPDGTALYPYSFALVPVAIYADLLSVGGARTVPVYEAGRREDVSARARYAQYVRVALDQHGQPNSPAEQTVTHGGDADAVLPGWGLLHRNGLAGAVAGVAASGPTGFDAVVEFLVFCATIEALRTEWRPQCGQGSQDEDYDLHVARAEAALRYCRRKMSEQE